VGNDAVDLLARVIAIDEAIAQLFFGQFTPREQLECVGVS
jgi:hypothetical protein